MISIHLILNWQRPLWSLKHLLVKGNTWNHVRQRNARAHLIYLIEVVQLRILLLTSLSLGIQSMCFLWRVAQIM
jgi:hypothetical protein